MKINLSKFEIKESKPEVKVLITDKSEFSKDFKFNTSHVYKSTEGLDYIEISTFKEELASADYYEIGYTLGQAITDYNSVDLEFSNSITDENAIDIIENAIIAITPVNFYNKEYSSKIKNILINNVISNFDFQSVLSKAQILANSYQATRVLNHNPYCICNPDTVTKFVEDNFKGTNAKVTVYRKDGCLEKQFSGLLALSKASSFEPSMIKIELCTDPTKEKIGLVGKGLTFDMGGYSIKIGKDLSSMKKDMAGANAVIGAMLRLASKNDKVNVTAYICLTDNLINEHAVIPGDIIKYPNDITVEVKNVDAEGRLVLADGILFAQNDNCTTVVDIATLTGSIGASIGDEFSGLFTNDDSSFEKINKSGESTGEKVWRMPLVDSYDSSIDSDLADICNISSLGYAGSITAALFLRRFVEDTKWLHIDMAAMSDKTIFGEKANGYGSRLLADFVINN